MSIQVLIFPPHTSWPAWTGRRPADDEDREQPYRILSQQGMTFERLEIHPFPLNPAARAHTLFRAVDPLRALKAMLARRHAEFVFCFFESSALVMLALRRLFGFRARVVIVDLGTPEWLPRRLILDFVVPRADAILPYSTSQAEAIRVKWPNAPLVIPVQAQVDTEFYHEAPDQPEGPVLAVGDDASRDYPTLLAAAPSIQGKVVVRSRVLRQADAGAASILSAPLPLQEYRDLVGSASIMVLPLHPVVNGGGTSAVVQAMACGKAVVVSASPGILDYVEDGVTALVVPPHDPVALRQAVNRLLSDHDLRRRMGRAARERALRLNSYEAWARTIEGVMATLDAQGAGAST